MSRNCLLALGFQCAQIGRSHDASVASEVDSIRVAPVPAYIFTPSVTRLVVDGRCQNCGTFERFFHAKAPMPPIPFARRAR